MKIALTGNPNSGKTTMFNALTGKNEHVGNWAGVTVEKKEGYLKKLFLENSEDVIIVDLPGAYSMSPFTSEEGIASEYVKKEKPDVIINIVDATNLSRSLFFTTQLLELGIPMVVALNKSDINEKKKTEISKEELMKRLGCPVVETVSTTSGNSGLKELMDKAFSVVGQTQDAPYIQQDINLQDKDAVKEADRKRYQFVNEIVKAVESRKVHTKEFNKQDKLDSILTNKYVGIPIFAIVMFLVFFISQSTLGTWIAEGYELKSGKMIPGLVTFIEMFQEWVNGVTEGANPFLRALLVDGIIGGVGAVLGFLPLVMVMFFLIALLEDCGYMARATVVLDPYFKKVGLSGKSVIPMVVGTGCAIPGVMACRTIRNERERRAMAMLTPFMPCGAKLPVIALFSGAFFSDAVWVGPVMYFVGILLILFGAILVNLVSGYRFKKSYFIMELPEYKLPSLKRAVVSMFSRGKEYIIKAGTIILLCNTVIQMMQAFDWRLQLVEEGMEHTSILATIASPIAIVLIPLGFGVWQMAAAAITGFIAKENVVGTLAVVYGITSFIDTEELALAGGAGEVAAILGLTKAAALAYLMFNLFTPPCFAAMGAMNAEIKDKKWLLGGIALQLGTGYSIAFWVYQIGTFILEKTLAQGFIPGLVGVLIMYSILAGLMIKARREVVR